MKVAVIGAGAAGAAAAWSGARAGADVTVLFDRAGASSMYSGALDLESWEVARADQELDGDTLAFCTAMGAWSVGPRDRWIATDAGIVRPARGIDSSLLDLVRLSGRTVAVAAGPPIGWDAEALARSLSASAWARRSGTRFVSADVALAEDRAEPHLPFYDLAARLDDEARADQLAKRLAEARVDCDGWLLGPFLGTRSGVAERIRRRLAKPCGETTSGPSGAAGARFDASRNELLSASAAVVEARVERLDRLDGGWAAVDRRGEELARADAVVLALGGVCAGGVVMCDPRTFGRPATFVPSVEAPVHAELDGHLLDRVSSLHGVDLTALGLSALERVGVAADGVRARGARGLYVAGDAVAGRPRTVLEAVRSGIAAGRAAATAD